MANDQICVGAIAGAFGVTGEVRLKSFCSDPAAIADYGRLKTETGSTEFDVKILRAVKGGFAARLSGVDSKEQADALRGTELFVDRENFPNLPDDEFYHADLVGLLALDTGGTELGRIKAVQNHGAGDLLELQLPSTSATTLLPFTRHTVPTVDLLAGRVIIDPPEGAF